MSDFVHLHLHSLYSLLDGAIKLNVDEKRNLFASLKEKGMDSVAVTDHGNMFGIIDFHTNAKKAGVRPIFGCEVYVAGEAGRMDRSRRESYHLVLLAKDLDGYKNLSYLVSMGFVEGFYYDPRIDLGLLARHSKGLIGMSACLGGRVSRALLAGDRDGALALARTYRDAFEPGSYFIEIQRTGLPEQEKIIPDLLQIARDLGVGVVATNDCHYLDREDARAHDVLMCIQTGKDYDDPARLRHDVSEYFLRSGEEMAGLFSDVPEAISNTRLIADMCRVELNFGKPFLPRFPVPQGYEVDDFFEKTARLGFEQRKSTRGLFAPEDAYRERLDFEISTIKKMGFASYFLIVWDFISHAKRKNIPVGPGRGSGAGSLVAYSLNITDLDPIRYGLLFERFLNPDRISMPDIDTDFCEKRRGEVIAYVREKYGENNVGQIVTFSQLNMKSIIKDVSRVLGFPYDVINKITKGIPSVVTEDDKVKKVNIDMALQLEPKLRELAERDAKFAEVIEISRTLEGLNRQIGTHAAGVVIAERPLWEMVPVCHGKEKQFQTQFDMGDAEKAGLIKFDFLGLKTLTVIDHTLRMLHGEGVEIDVSNLALDDPKVYEIISKGETDGVFQLESGGFKEMLKRLRPTRFEEIVSATALHRPGPMKAGIEDDYIERKNGRKRITYPHPASEPFLKETYGVIVYQEQVMQLSVALSGFSKGGADKLRKAMGKKNAVEMEKLGADFVGGAVRISGMTSEAATALWEQIQQFAGYAFNKSHSAAYSVVTYQTAWLKAHYPVHFMAALLSSEVDKPENVVNYIQAAKRMGIKVLPPDLNESEENFSVRGGKIRFGLLAVRGLGEAAIAEILAARKKGGAFKSLLDFCNRVDLRRVTKKSMEMLIRGGALDFTGKPRAALSASLSTAVEAAGRSQKSRSVGQHSLFGEMQPDDVAVPEIGEWDEKDRLSAEKEALGFYVSGHPMEKYAAELRRYVSATVSELEDVKGPAEVTVGGVVVRLDVKATKSGQGKMAVAAVEDLTGQTEVMIPPQVFEGAEAPLRGFEPVCVRCFLAPEQNDDDQEDEQGEGAQRKFKRTRLRAMQVLSMSDIRRKTVGCVLIRISMKDLAGGAMKTLKGLVESHKGTCGLALEISDPESSMRTVVAAGNGFKVSPDDSLVSDVARAFPDAVVEFN